MSIWLLLTTKLYAALAEEKAINALIAEKNGLPVGFAVYNFYLLSTFSGRRIMYLEDLF